MVIKINKNKYKVKSGHNKRVLMCVLFKDIVDMDFKEKLINFSLNTLSKNPILTFFFPMEFLIRIQNFKSLLTKSLKIIKISLNSKSYVNR